MYIINLIATELRYGSQRPLAVKKLCVLLHEGTCTVRNKSDANKENISDAIFYLHFCFSFPILQRCVRVRCALCVARATVILSADRKNTSALVRFFLALHPSCISNSFEAAQLARLTLFLLARALEPIAWSFCHLPVVSIAADTSSRVTLLGVSVFARLVASERNWHSSEVTPGSRDAHILPHMWWQPSLLQWSHFSPTANGASV